MDSKVDPVCPVPATYANVGASDGEQVEAPGRPSIAMPRPSRHEGNPTLAELSGNCIQLGSGAGKRVWCRRKYMSAVSASDTRLARKPGLQNVCAHRRHAPFSLVFSELTRRPASTTRHDRLFGTRRKPSSPVSADPSARPWAQVPKPCVQQWIGAFAPVVSRSWWKLSGAGTDRPWWVGSGGEVKVDG